MKYKYILFDLDGTLTNSGEGIINSLEFAFKEMNMDVPPRSTLEKFIGPPLMTSFHDIMHFDDDLAAEAIKKYRKRYLEKGLYENCPYEGIEDVLSAAVNSGKILAVATSKPEFMSLRVVEYFNLKHYFKVIAGAANEAENKTDVILKACKRLGVDDKEKDTVLMVGDRKHDIIGAHECNIKCCGVRYGFAPDGEFEEYGADYIVDTTQDLKNFLVQI